MRRTTTMAAALATGLALATATGAFAQPYGPGPGMGPGYGMGAGPGYGPGQGMGPGHAMGPGHGHGMMHARAHGWGGGFGAGPQGLAADPATAVEARLAALKVYLKITPAQEGAWQAVLTQAKEQAKAMQAARSTMQSAAGTAPDRMTARAALMKQRAEGMTAMAGALKGLYAVLTPEQKAVVDQHFGMHGQRGGRFGRAAG